jgi:hypothetical protein
MISLTAAEVDGLWVELDQRERELKLANYTLVRLGEIYDELDADSRDAFERVVVGWLASADPRKRFDALGLVSGKGLMLALPIVRRMLEDLSGATGPSVPFDRAKLERIISKLGRAATEGSG